MEESIKFCWMCTYIIGSDSACRVSRYKLDLHINVGKQIFIFGLKPWARGFVKRKSEKIAIVQYVGSAISPCYVKILIEVGSRSCKGIGQYQCIKENDCWRCGMKRWHGWFEYKNEGRMKGCLGQRSRIGIYTSLWLERCGSNRGICNN